MNFKKIFLFVCLTVCLSGAAICASDVGETDFHPDFNESHFQCCSFAIQENAVHLPFRKRMKLSLLLDRMPNSLMTE